MQTPTNYIIKIKTTPPKLIFLSRSAPDSPKKTIITIKTPSYAGTKI
jgi:hypothetical protein